MRKSITKLVAAAFLASVAFTAPPVPKAEASNLPLFTSSSGCFEASQIIPCMNQLVNSINLNGAGLMTSSPTQATTTGTTIQTLATLTIPPGMLAATGQAVRAKCFGSGTSTGTNTLTIQVGSATAFAVAGAATTAGAFDVEVIVLKTGASTQQILSKGQFNATLTAETIVSGSNTDTGPINITCSGTSTTTGQFTLNGAIAEQIK